MDLYLLLGIVTHFAVNWLLLLAVDRGLQYYYSGIRCMLAAVFAALYATVCIQLQLAFLNHIVCRIASIALTCVIAFGIHRSALKRGFIFLLLRFSLEGIGSNPLLWSVVLAIACFCVLRLGRSAGGYVPVSLFFNGRQIKLQALYDTGHKLQDPITGRHVLVVDREIAHQLTGLTTEQLRDPLQTIQQKDGFCLLPFQAVGIEKGLLLGIHIKQARIGSKKGKILVALCAEQLDSTGKFQGLIGGAL